MKIIVTTVLIAAALSGWVTAGETDERAETCLYAADAYSLGAPL